LIQRWREADMTTFGEKNFNSIFKHHAFCGKILSYSITFRAAAIRAAFTKEKLS
jgi:hypothetical protein